MNKVGDYIKKRRILKGLTQQELAEKTGYKTRASINQIEKNRVNVPPEKLDIFAHVLDCSLNDLLSLQVQQSTQTPAPSNNNVDLFECEDFLKVTQTKNLELNVLLLKIWSKYIEEYKKEKNELDNLMLQLYTTKNKISQTNETYKHMSNELIKLNNMVDNSTLNEIINRLKNIDIKTINEYKQLLSEIYSDFFKSL